MIPTVAYRLQPRLAEAAQSYVGAGWPVAPGSWWDAADARYRCAPAGCMTEALHPTVPDIEPGTSWRCQVSVARSSTRDIEQVARPWGRRPYSVLLPTGYVCDAVELRGATAQRVQNQLASYDLHGPIAACPDGRILLFTVATGPLDEDLTAEVTAAGAFHHSKGSWVPLPPSPLAGGPVQWTESPAATRWRLPSLQIVADALRLALRQPALAEGT